MQAIILANRTGSELSPLNQHYCPALLRIGSKTVIEYTIEDLATAGITNIKMVISVDAEQIEAYLQSGQRWGVQIEYFLSKPEENTLDTLNRLSLRRDDSTIIIRGDIFRSPCVEKFVQFSARFPAAYVEAKMAGMNAGMMLLPAAIPYIDELNWPLSNDHVHADAVTLVLHGQNFHLQSLRNYMLANQQLIQGEVKGLTPNEMFVANEQYGGFYLGEKVQINPQSMQSAQGLVGAKSWLDDSVKVDNTVIVGEHSLIGANSKLNNCIVLPNTFVGEDLELQNVIVSKNLLINLSHEGHITVDDPTLLAANEITATHSETHSSQWLRLSLLICSPIIALATCLLAIVSLIKHPNNAIVTEHLTDNDGSPFTSWRFNLQNRFLSLLPQLRHVISGRLALFGASATTQHPQSSNNQTLGVLGPVQLLLPNNAPEEERRLIELTFTSDPKTSKYAQLVLATLKQSTTNVTQ
ncbi:sugar phosphate nucleotidyltransferase [Shewanella waksmanii]|uniref:sugar phosphate nucleotidyltransferase n=1 Tax=Shewanella waksmanii TaxID=213783 RepID=UPI0037363CC5